MNAPVEPPNSSFSSKATTNRADVLASVERPEPDQPGRPRSKEPLVAFALAVVGLTASSLLLVDYTREASVFCSEDGGCERVRAWALQFGAPIPTLGVLFFLALGTVVWLRGPRAQGAHALLSVAGALGAVVFLALQALVIHAFCKYCVVVDFAAFFGGILGARRYLQGTELEIPRFRGLLPTLLALAAIGPFTFGMGMAAHLPAAIVELTNDPASTTARELKVVVFTDFECPHCRALHEKLTLALRAAEDAGIRVRVYRIDRPLRMHEHAKDAARAHACAERLGGPQVAEKMAHGLFALPPEAYLATPLTGLATSLGLEERAFSTCLGDASLEDAFVQNTSLFQRVGGRGLPLAFVGTDRFDGDTDFGNLKASVERQIRALR